MLRPACPRVRSAVLQPGSGPAADPAAGGGWSCVIHGHGMEPRRRVRGPRPSDPRGSVRRTTVRAEWRALRPQAEHRLLRMPSPLAADRDEEIDGGGPGDRRRDRGRGECGLRRCPHPSSGGGRRSRRGTPARRPTDPDRRRPAPRRYRLPTFLCRQALRGQAVTEPTASKGDGGEASVPRRPASPLRPRSLAP